MFDTNVANSMSDQPNRVTRKEAPYPLKERITLMKIIILIFFRVRNGIREIKGKIESIR